MEGTKNLSEAMIRAMVNEVDVSGDGEIDFGEFLFMMHLGRNRHRETKVVPRRQHQHQHQQHQHRNKRSKSAAFASGFQNVGVCRAMPHSGRQTALTFGARLGGGGVDQATQSMVTFFNDVEAKANLVRGQLIFYLFLFLLFCVLVSCSTTVFHYFKCNDFPEADGGGRSWLYRDYAVDCRSGRYRTYIIFAVRAFSGAE